MKKLSVYLLSFLCMICMVCGVVISLSGANVETAEAATATVQTVPTLSKTKYKISKDKTGMLLATGIKDFECVYEIGYAFKDTDGVEKLHAITTKYYTSITSGSSTWTVEDMFGSEYTGMIVWEVEYDLATAYSYQAYAKVGEMTDEGLVKTDNIVYGTRKDLLSQVNTVTFMSGGETIATQSATVNGTYGTLPEAPKAGYSFKGWYLNEDGMGEAITSDTKVKITEDHVLYAVYEPYTTYDFRDDSQMEFFGYQVNTTYSIVNDANGNYLKITGQPSTSNNIVVFKRDLTAGSVVEIDIEYITTDSGTWVDSATSQVTFLAYEANADGSETGDPTVMGNASWDGGWNLGKYTLSKAISSDCYGVRMQFKFNSDTGAYFKINGIRVIEYPYEYDFTSNKVLSDFVSLDNGSVELVEDANSNYLKLTPVNNTVTSDNTPQSVFWLKHALTAGMTVEIDFKLVGTINVGHGVWTYGAGENGTELFEGQFTTAWDAPNRWNDGNFTASTTITQDCYGVRILVRYAKNADAYWMVTGIRIMDSGYPTYTVAYDVDGKKTYATVTYGSTYGELPAAPEQLGYSFKGWYFEPMGVSEAVTAETVVTTLGDHTLYAVYEEVGIVTEKDRTEYDFTSADQIDAFGYAVNTTYSIVNDANGNYLKITGQPSTSNNIVVFKRDLTAGSVVEIDIEYITTDSGTWVDSATSQVTFLAYEANADGSETGDPTVMGNASWDGGWNLGKYTLSKAISSDCYGVRMQFKFNSDTGAYFKINGIRVIEYPYEYDFTSNKVLSDFVSLDNGSVELVEDANSNYLKLTPVNNTVTSDNTPQSVFWLKHALTAGMTVEIDFKLVGTINVGHGVWTYGAGENGTELFEGQFTTAWDAPNRWNDGNFTASTTITQDCYGVRILVRYAKNADAYWMVTGIRIVDGEYPTYAVTYDVDGEKSYATVTYGSAYGELPVAPEKEWAEFKGWYFNELGEGEAITAETVVSKLCNHTVYAVYNEYSKTPNFFEEIEVKNIVDLNNTDIQLVRDASGNYLKLSPTVLPENVESNENQSEIFFKYPYLKAGWTVEMDFELVGDIVSAHGIWTFGANEDGSQLFDGQWTTGWDAPDRWNNGNFTTTTEITQDCYGVRVRIRYAHSANAYWKLTGIRVYSLEERCDIATYADDKQIDIGGWSWMTGDLSETQLEDLQEAGITMLAGVFMGGTGTEAEETAFLDRAQKYGIKILFQKEWDGSTIPSYVDHEAFMGYCVADEPPMRDLSDLKTLKETWDASALKNKLFFVNLYPVYSNIISLGTWDYDAYMEEAITNSGFPVVSFDHYPLYDDNGTTVLRTDWLENFDIASYYAETNSVPLWYTLLTTQHTGSSEDYIDPTAADLQYQMFVAMTYGTTNLMHYTFAGTGEDHKNPIMENPNYTGTDEVVVDENGWTDSYYDAKDAAAKIGEWDHVFMNFNWLGVSTVTGSSAQTGLITSDLEYSVSVDKYGVISSVNSTQDVLVGHFQDSNGYNGVMITNLTMPENNTSASVTVAFSDEYKAVMVYQNGEEKFIPLHNGVLSINVASAEGIFIIPVKLKA